MLLFKTRRFVQFAETDMAGIVHFTNYLRYLEEAEHAFLRDRGCSVVMHDERGAFGFPKMSIQCEFCRPVRHEEWLDIELMVSTSDQKTIDYDCTIFWQGTLVARGSIKVACCRFPPHAAPYPIPLPDSILKALESPSLAS